MGGETPIPYSAISRYARDHCIAGEDFEIFHQMLTAIDDEWLEHAARKRKEEAEK
ncbi:hypothetical protein [Mesorhizobium sp.]|uniref:phage tail assembly chaperone n=1 Tax=Mesorhizobium sp. TaxID=1871066 RepID=UPI0025C3AB6A|nr:hypothetical protein [Mesorhizobium sp.]